MNVTESNARVCYGSYYQPPETAPVIGHATAVAGLLNTPQG